MGLGKTVQISTFLTALLRKKLISKGLVVVPATLINYWETELVRWTPPDYNAKIIKFNGTKQQRRTAVTNVINRNIIGIISP